MRSQITNWRFLAIFAIILLAWTAFRGRTDITPVMQYIARIKIEGVIGDELERNLSLNAIAEDKRIKAVIVHINSPGGSFVGGQNIFYGLRKVSAQKPVVSVMGEIAASGGYMAAIGGDYIFAREGTLTGSIGVFLKSYDITELAERLGIKFEVFKTSIYKYTPNPWEKLPPEAKVALDETIESSYIAFSKMVGERRKIDPEKLKAVANGRVYNGVQALHNNLIDALGGEDEAIEWLQRERGIDKDMDIVDVHLVKPASRLDRLLDSLSSIASFAHAGFRALYS